MDKRKRNIIFIGILVLVLSVISFTYAIWSAFFEQKDPNLLATSCFQLSFKEDENFDMITLQKAHPITEEEGLQLDPYKFTITNNCQDYAAYEIHLEIDEESNLSDYNAVHVDLDQESFILGSKQVVTTTLENATTAYSLTKGYLNKGESKDFELRMWIDEDADASIAGQQFLSQVTLTASYVVDIPKTLEETIKALPVQLDNSGNSGIYLVNHDGAEITWEGPEDQKTNLQQTEYRYAGKDPDNYVDVGDKYDKDIYGLFKQYKHYFETNEKCNAYYSEYMKYLEDSGESADLTECTSSKNTEGAYLLEYKYSADAPVSTTELFESSETCQSAKNKYESYGRVIVQNCTQPESIYSYTETFQEDYSEYSEDECNAMKARSGGICMRTHQAGDPIYWRLIGLVNTPEGQRAKLVRSTSIGNYSWDTSSEDVNFGGGINEWKQSDLMKLLNSGYETNKGQVCALNEAGQSVTCSENDITVNNSLYWDGKTGKCYTEESNTTTDCDFTNNTIPENLKKMIETVTWNTGSNDGDIFENNDMNVNDFYNLERSSNTGKICDNSSEWCNDGINRTNSWRGKVALMYPSDYGYATSGGVGETRDTCLNLSMVSIISDISAESHHAECYKNDWLLPSEVDWTLSPVGDSGDSSNVFNVTSVGYLTFDSACYAEGVRPTVYLKSKVFVKQGNGSKDDPYILEV